MRRWVVLLFIIGSIATWLRPAVAHAQATGTVSGVMTDGSGSAVPGVSVEIVSEATGQARTTTTASDGVFSIPLVNPGTYRLVATLDGFKTAVRDAVVVTVSQTTRVDVQLELGQVTETLTIRGQPPLVETSHATLGVVVDRQQVVDLPLNGRNFTQLGTLIPGVVAAPAALGGQAGDATPGGFGNVTGGFNVNGLRNQSNNFLLDGASNNDTFNTGFVLRPPPDAIQEFKILTHSYGAEHGRQAGSIVNVVTRSGSNQWQGGAWEFNRDDALEARNYFAVGKPTLRQNQFGGSLGGPIVRNRAFLFGYYEGYRNTRGTTNTSTVLSEAQRAGNVAGGTLLRDPQTGQPFAGNTIPADRISPIARQLLDTYIPLPNGAGNRYTKSPNVTDDRDQIGVRGDFRHTNRHSMLGRFLYATTERVDPIGPSNFAPAGNVSKATLSDVLVSDTLVLRSNLVNVARVGFNRIDANPTVTSGLNPRDLGWSITQSNPLAAGLPFVSVSGFFTTGDVQQPFASRLNESLSITDDVSWVHDRHSFKFGGEVRRDRIDLAFINRPNGDFTFNGQYTGSAGADFLLGFPSQYRQASGDPNLDGSMWAYAAYAQDEIRLSSRVTLTVGARYELAVPFAEKDDKLNAFHPGRRSTRFPDAPEGLVYPGDESMPRGTYETDTNNVAPRLAVVWDPTGKGRTSVRAAWGVFYDAAPGQGDFFQNGTLAPPFQPLTEVNYSLVATTPAFADPLSGVGGGTAFPAGLIFIGWSADGARTAAVQHYNLTVQHQPFDAIALEAGYVGSRGEHLPIFMEVNPTIPVLTPTPRTGPRLFPAFSLVRPTFSVARSRYDSFQASARLLPWKGLHALASYTWSHAIDHVSGLNIGGEARPMLPVEIGNEASFDAALARERGDALFDVPHRFVLSFGYELPTLDARGPLARYTLGGWQLNGIIQAQSGFPLTVIEPNNISLLSLTNRPDAVCDPNEGAPHTTAQWFDTSCFQRLTLAQNAGQLGNAGRNTVRGPGFARTDLSLFKNIDLSGRHQLQLRIEAFNVFDQTRFGQPGATIGSPTFGAITSADDGRIVQLGVKYRF